MKNTHLRSITAAHVAVLSLLIFAGCSTTAQYPAERHAQEAVAIQTLSPREYLRAVDPWERREIERNENAAYFAKQRHRREQGR